MIPFIDINADVGERPEALNDGSEERLIRLLSSANIACGVHAGDEASMRATVRLCARYGISVGAHPSYPDRENFGRKEMALSSEEVEACVYEQVMRLAAISSEEGRPLVHVKPHGALYHSAAHHTELAAAIGRAVRKAASGAPLVLVGLAGSPMLDVWRNQGMAVAGEAFADRRYESDGMLRSRTLADALITQPAEAVGQALQIILKGSVLSVGGSLIRIAAETICVHSDTPGALAILSGIREAFQDSGIRVSALRLPGP
jgi:5-oxoprolinase (ATP-hydrolysing) subunit A